MVFKRKTTWNSLISCYEKNGPASEALKVFLKMIDCRLEPNEVILANVASACAKLFVIKEGLQSMC